MRKLKSVSVLLAVMFLLMSIAACGGGNNEGNNGGNSAANTGNAGDTNTAQDNTEAVNEPAPPAEEQTPALDISGRTIKIDAWWKDYPAGDSAEEENRRQIIADVEKKYNIKIEFTETPWGENIEKLTTSVLAGEPYADIVRVEPFHAKPNLIVKDLVQPLEDLMDTGWFPDDVRKLGSYQGKMYGFVKENLDSGTGVWYNKGIFQREGLPDLYELQQSGEWTWDKFREIAKAATKDTNGSGKINQWGIANGPNDLAYPLIISNGGHVYEEETGKFVGNEPNAVEALTFLQQLFSQDKVFAPGEGECPLCGGGKFETGQGAMHIGSSWEGSGFKEKMTDDFGFVFFPKGPKAEGYASFSASPNMWYLPKGVKNPEAVLQVWKEINTYDSSLTSWKEGQFTSEQDGETYDKMREALVIDIGQGFPKIGELFNGKFEAIATGKENPATLVEKIKNEVQADIDSVLSK